MLNLLSNSVKFTKEGGKIIVTVKHSGEYISISVKDNGVGIPFEKQQCIFERFRQADRTLTRGHEGSGIGLSLAKSIIEIHGGTINVESEYGKGSEFTVNIPCKVLSNQQHHYDNLQDHGDYVERINIEFSDIYS
jgi:signal transduction histidine kinase